MFTAVPLLLLINNYMKNIWREIFPSTSLRLLYPKTLRYGLDQSGSVGIIVIASSQLTSHWQSRETVCCCKQLGIRVKFRNIYIKSGKKCKLILYFVENIYIVYFQIKICLIYYGNTLSNKINTGLQCSKSVD